MFDENLLAPGLIARAEARLRHVALDEALAGGADPSASAALARRAAVLTRPATRDVVADALAQVLAAAAAPPSRVRVPPRRREALAAEEQVRDLERRLRDDAPVYAQGVALVATLVTDGTGPLYQPRSDRRLADQLAAARDALDG